MKGVISTYDTKKGVGRVQGEDGHIYSFKRDALLKAEDVDCLKIHVNISFEPHKDETTGNLFAHDIDIVDREAAMREDEFYVEPSTFQCHVSDLIDGYDILDRGIYPLSKAERSEENAKRRLIAECLAVGANACVSYRVEETMRISFGMAFCVYHARGVPVVIGQPAPNGEASYEELHNRLDQEKIRKNHNMFINTKIGKIVVKWLAIVLVIIFTIGFIVSGGI